MRSKLQNTTAKCERRDDEKKKKKKNFSVVNYVVAEYSRWSRMTFGDFDGTRFSIWFRRLRSASSTVRIFQVNKYKLFRILNSQIY